MKHSISVASAPTGAIIVGHTRFNRVYAEEEEAGSRSKKKGQGKEEKGQEEKNVGIFPDRDSMSQFARDNLDVSNWLMSARTIFQQRHKMNLECKEIEKKMRQQANEAGQGNDEELESRIQNAIEKHKDENYEMFDSEIDSESDESGNEAEMNIYKKPNMIKRWGLPRLYKALSEYLVDSFASCPVNSSVGR